MKNLHAISFTRLEAGLWLLSVAAIVASFVLFQADNVLILAASVIGATFLILNAKGYVLGQILTVVFSVLYGIVSYRSAYYGEMITYLGMTTPIAIASVVTWAKNPAQKGRPEVQVNQLQRREYLFVLALSCVVTAAFYVILKSLGTAALALSTLSVFTSFVAAYLTMRRSEYFALGYAANDMVLIALWLIASAGNRAYLSMVICFVVFLINDLYGFCSWCRMKKAQASAGCTGRRSSKGGAPVSTAAG